MLVAAPTLVPHPQRGTRSVPTYVSPLMHIVAPHPQHARLLVPDLACGIHPGTWARPPTLSIELLNRTLGLRTSLRKAPIH
jgi:hypothetical protein